jgi:ElaB/YqjD/DUF883 family membrane-anchored ribosome-binding protein
MNAHNGHNDYETSKDIEREVERTRAHMAETLDELRARMSPGQILDEVLGYAKDSGGGQMVRNLGRSVQDNPVPLVLIGVGVAWMMAGNGRGRDYSPAGSGEGARRAGAGVSDAIASAAGAVSDTVSAAAGAVSDTASGLRDSAMRRANDFRETASSTMQGVRGAVHRSEDSAYRSGRDLSSAFTALINDQPMLLGALGVAVGAALGAALPETEAEDRLMGEASDAMKEKAGEVAAAGYEKAKAVAESVVERGSEEAEAQRLTASEFEDAMSDLASSIGSVVEAGKDAALEEASNQNLVDDGSRPKDRTADGPASRPSTPATEM